MNHPIVSVVMPAYNHERFIGEAVQSVLEQSLQELRLIVIDDGSTDGTGAVVKSFDDTRIEYFYQPNQDAYNTLNRGLRMAQTPFVSILNSDDVYEPDRLVRLMQVQGETDAVCIFTQVTPIAENGEVFTDPAFFWHQWHNRNREFYFACGDLYQAFLRSNLMVTTSNLFLTQEAVRRVGDFCPFRYLHDYDYIFRVMLEFPEQTHYLHDEALVRYRIHGSNTLSEAAITGREQDQQVIRKYTLMQCPAKTRKRVETGIDRLIELEHELIEVRRQLTQA